MIGRRDYGSDCDALGLKISGCCLIGAPPVCYVSKDRFGGTKEVD